MGAVPVKYNREKIGKVSEINLETGEVTINLDVDNAIAQAVMQMMISDIPMSMSCRTEPSKPDDCKCGAKSSHIIKELSLDRWTCYCNSCGCNGAEGCGETREEAIKNFNCR